MVLKSRTRQITHRISMTVKVYSRLRGLKIMVPLAGSNMDRITSPFSNVSKGGRDYSSKVEKYLTARL